MPEVTEQDMQALELMAEEQIRAVGGVAAPQPGPVPPAGGGGVGLAAGAYPALPGPTRGDPSLPPNYAHQHRSRYREGRGRRYFRRAKEKPVETVAGVAGFSLTVSKCVAFMKNHTIFQEYLVTFSIYWNYAKEGVLKAQSEVKEMGWDGILLTVIAVFFVLRVMSALLGDQSGPDPPQQPGGRPPGSFHHRPPYRPPGTPGGAVGDLADRIGNFQNINSQDHRAQGGGGPGGGGLFSRAKQQLTRLRRSAMNPMDVFSKFIEEVVGYSDWPYTGDISVRLAAEYLAPIYGSGRRGVYYARQYISDHGMEGTHLGAVFERIFCILDEIILFDGINVLNMAGGEYLARWAYAIEKATSECTKKEHLSGERKSVRTRWDLFAYYDIWSVSKRSTGVESADTRVTDTMKRDALFMKYLERVQAR